MQCVSLFVITHYYLHAIFVISMVNIYPFKYACSLARGNSTAMENHEMQKPAFENKLNFAFINSEELILLLKTVLINIVH